MENMNIFSKLILEYTVVAIQLGMWWDMTITYKWFPYPALRPDLVYAVDCIQLLQLQPLVGPVIVVGS